MNNPKGLSIWVRQAQDVGVSTQPPAFRLKAGQDYPSNDADLRAWFPDDAACLDYLEWLRWPDGFVCPQCKMPGRWRVADGRFWCAGCRRRMSVTAGTIFHRTRTPLTIWFEAAWCATSAHADTFGSGGNTFTIGFVPIGNAGNANDTVNGAGTNYGAVPYNFNMSTYAISQDQLAKASNSLGISLGGSAWVGSQPSANVTWYQAAAFVNYLNTSTAHAKAYNLNAGATALTLWTPSDAGNDATNLYRNKNAYYFLPSENESYKAAYYDPNKAGGAGYWLYATGSNAIPTAVASGTAQGTAVYGGGTVVAPAAVDASGGLSPCLTMGQSGNVYAWQENALDGVNDVSSALRAIRGGYWGNSELVLRSSFHSSADPSNPNDFLLGFRVASVPEPSSVAASLLGVGVLMARRRRR